MTEKTANTGGDAVIKTIELVGQVTGNKDMDALAKRVRDFDAKHKTKR